MAFLRGLPKPVWVAVLLAIGLLIFAACGEEEEGPISGQTPPAAATEIPPGGGLAPQPEKPGTAQDIQAEVVEPSNGVIETAMGDNFFTKNNFKVTLGQSVTIRATNEGQAIHNLRIAAVDGEWNTADDFFTSEGGDKPGDTGEFVFTPDVAGTYVFRCDFHPTEMWGQIVVESSPSS